MMFAVGVVLLATSALLAPWLQTLGDYPVATAGLVMAPRGIGTMAAMMIAGRLSSRVDPRYLMGLGVLMMAWSLYAATGWTPDVSPRVLIATLMVQGAALGFVFIPLQVVAFATLPAAYRTDGTSLLSLLRNVGSAIGVSVTSALLAHNVQVLHSELGSYITPFNRALQAGGAVSQFLDPSTARGAQILDAIVNRQAQIIAYNDDYKLMTLITLPTLLLLFIMRRPNAPPKAARGGDGHPAVLD
jgi:DHA2 family multidrug resistance protein